MEILYWILKQIYDPFGERHKDIVQGVALALVSIAWVFLVGVTISRIESYDPIIVIRVLTLFTVLAGVVVAAWKLKNDQDFRQSETYLGQSIELFSKAFEMISPKKGEAYPENNRYKWLSSARLILAAQKLGLRIKDPSHKDTYIEYEDYWRMKFYETLKIDDNSFPEKEYFFEEGKLRSYGVGDREPLAEKSIAVLYRFSKWPKGREDLLDEESKFSEAEIDRFRTFGPKSLYEYCQEARGANK